MLDLDLFHESWRIHLRVCFVFLLNIIVCSTILMLANMRFFCFRFLNLDWLYVLKTLLVAQLIYWFGVRSLVWVWSFPAQSFGFFLQSWVFYYLLNETFHLVRLHTDLVLGVISSMAFTFYNQIKWAFFLESRIDFLYTARPFLRFVNTIFVLRTLNLCRVVYWFINVFLWWLSIQRFPFIFW